MHVGEFKELRIEPYGLVGFRWWRLARDEQGVPILRAVTQRWEWAGPTAYADRLPGVGTNDRNGLHALADPERLRRPIDPRDVVVGEVVLSGVVAVHDRGFRAERATIARLAIRRFGVHGPRGEFCACDHGTELDRVELEGLAGDLAARYECPVSILVDPPTGHLRWMPGIHRTQLDLFQPAAVVRVA